MTASVNKLIVIVVGAVSFVRIVFIYSDC